MTFKKYPLLILFFTLSMAGCSDDSEPNVPVYDLAPILEDGYWNERSVFIRETDGKREFTDSAQTKTGTITIRDFGKCYVRNGGIVKFFTLYDADPSFYISHDSAYLFRYGGGGILVEPLQEKYKATQWFSGQRLAAIAATESEVVLETPIRGNLRRLYGIGFEYVGIRTTWTRIETPYDADRWGADLTNALPDWTEGLDSLAYHLFSHSYRADEKAK